MTSSLAVVEVSTTEGSVYRFPDVSFDAASCVKAGPSESSTTLLLVNASGATLTLPWRIVEKIWVQGKILWKKASRA